MANHSGDFFSRSLSNRMPLKANSEFKKVKDRPSHGCLSPVDVRINIVKPEEIIRGIDTQRS